MTEEFSVLLHHLLPYSQSGGSRGKNEGEGTSYLSPFSVSVLNTEKLTLRRMTEQEVQKGDAKIETGDSQIVMQDKLLRSKYKRNYSQQFLKTKWPKRAGKDWVKAHCNSLSLGGFGQHGTYKPETLKDTDYSEQPFACYYLFPIWLLFVCKLSVHIFVVLTQQSQYA